MDETFLSQLEQFQEFHDKLSQFEQNIAEKHEEHEMIERRKDAEFDLWHSILSSDITHLESDIQSKQVSLMGLKLEFETIKTTESLEKQKCHMNETDCKKLRRKYLTLEKLIARHSLTGHIDENTYNVTMGVSLHYGKEYLINGSIFSNILYFENIQTIMNIEIVCKSWKYAINNWKGWKDYNLEYIWNNADYLFMGNKSHFSELSTASSKGSKNEEVYLPRFRRFVLTIETQKNNQFQIEVAGFADKNTPLQDAVTHDRSKKKVVLQPVEGSDALIKEFQICDVILSNHQNLAKIKADCARLQNRSEADKRTQKGYQIQTESINNEIQKVDKQVKEQRLQQDSDIQTIKFLEGTINNLNKTLDELSAIPARLDEDAKRQKEEFDAKMNELNEQNETSMKAEISKLNKEKGTLTQAIKLEQSNLRNVTEQRDKLRKRYEFLKSEIAKITRGGGSGGGSGGSSSNNSVMSSPSPNPNTNMNGNINNGNNNNNNNNNINGYNNSVARSGRGPVPSPQAPQPPQSPPYQHQQQQQQQRHYSKQQQQQPQRPRQYPKPNGNFINQNNNMNNNMNNNNYNRQQMRPPATGMANTNPFLNDMNDNNSNNNRQQPQPPPPSGRGGRGVRGNNNNNNRNYQQQQRFRM